MAKEGGESESKGLQPETNASSMGKEGASEPSGKGLNPTAGKSTNYSSHDKMVHKLMPNGYKGDCGY